MILVRACTRIGKNIANKYNVVRLKTWSTSDFWIAETAWQTCLYIYLYMFHVDKYRLRRAERWEYALAVSSEVGEI